MPDAFHCHAFDYLIKPIDNERLRKTILDALAFLPEKEEYLELPVRKQNVPIFYSDIRYVLASSNYCMVYTKEEYRCRMSFSQFEKLLEKDGSFSDHQPGRPHQSGLCGIYGRTDLPDEGQTYLSPQHPQAYPAGAGTHRAPVPAP